MQQVYKTISHVWRRFSGPTRSSIRRGLDRHQWCTPDELLKIQWKRLKRLLEHAYKHVPFYHRRFGELGIKPRDICTMKDFRKIPILKKSDIQQNLNELVAANYDVTRLRRDSTGGSTGNPITFYRDQTADLWFREGEWVGRSWFGHQPGDKLALIWGADRDIPSSYPPNQRWLNSFNYSSEQIEAFIQELVEWHPKVIRGYASSLFLVASYIETHHLQAPHPEAIESSAEKMWDWQRTLVEDVFQCKVFDMYGSREVPWIACECNLHTGLHVFSDMRLVEIIRDGFLSARPGKEGSCIITDLTNYSMPFIRYEISDIGVLSEDLCPCGRGFPLLKEIKGRVTNTIVTPDGRYIHGEYFTHLFYHVPGVKSFQARQRSIDKIEVAVQPDNGFEPALIDQLIDKIRSHLGRGVEVQWSIVPEIPPAPSGKRHFTISDIPIDFTSLGTQG